MMPRFYQGGLPLYWGNEQSGALIAAVRAFFAHMLDQGQPFTPEQLRLVCDYLMYYIDAPCWGWVGDEGLPELRAQAKTMKSAQDINKWIQRCLDVGIDPL